MSKNPIAKIPQQWKAINAHKLTAISNVAATLQIPLHTLGLECDIGMPQIV